MSEEMETPGNNEHNHDETAPEEHRLHTEDVHVTPELAARWLEEYRFPEQRPLDPYYVEDHKRRLAKGTFKPGAVEICLLGDRKYLTDGQHRLAAISESDISVWMAVVYHPCKTYEEVKEIYYRTDAGQQRGPALAIDVAGLAEEYEMTNSQLGRISSAVNFAYAGFRNPGGHQTWAKDRDVRLRMLREWVPYGKQYYEITAGAGRELLKALKNRDAMSVGLVLLRYQEEKATEFLTKIVEHDRLERDSAEMIAYQELLRTQVPHGRGKPRAEVLARILAACWNAYATGGRVSLNWKKLKPTDPARLEGTPFNGVDLMPLQPPL